MEIVGRFPTDEEVNDFEVAKTTPVWLPTTDEQAQFTPDVRAQLTCLREAIMSKLWGFSPTFFFKNYAASPYELIF